MSKDTLKHSLQALAQPSDFQRRLLRVWLNPPAELPERFVHAHRRVLADRAVTLTNAQSEALRAVHTKLESFAGPAHAGHWREEALATSPHWESVRQAARQCLETFGWQIEPPPLDSVSYGEDFHDNPAA